MDQGKMFNRYSNDDGALRSFLTKSPKSDMAELEVRVIMAIEWTQLSVRTKFSSDV